MPHDFNLKCYEETQVLTFSFTWVLFLDHVCHDIGSFCCSHGIGGPSHLSCVVADLIVDNIISHRRVDRGVRVYYHMTWLISIM